MNLKAFVVSDIEYAEHGAELVYAESREQARMLGCRGLEISYADSHAKRMKEFDHLAGDLGPRVENNNRVLRGIGWQCEGEDNCSSCGLSSMGMDEFAVCAECQQCKECGCVEHEKEQP